MSDAKANGRTSSRNPNLDLLNRLAGEWKLEALLDGQMFKGGRVTFEWLADRAFLVQRSEVDDLSELPPGWAENAPHSTVSIIGLDDTSEQFTMLYADSSDVFRVYQMRLSDGVWTLWRDAPGFSQRFTGIFNEDGDMIEGRWERSDDGVEWVVDFDLTYTRVEE